jgi:hypothetical protein
LRASNRVRTIVAMKNTEPRTAQDYLSLAAHYQRAAADSSNTTERMHLQTIASTYVALAESTTVLTESEKVSRGLRTSNIAK